MIKTERMRNSMLNGLSNLVVNLTITVLSFAVRTIFLKTLGEQCLGLDGLYTNILSFLSLAELGFSASISFSLYEPLAKKNYEKVSALMYYFKKVYQTIALVIIGVGILVLPFLSFMVKDYTVSYNIYLIFLLYLINTASTYLTSYSTILLEADQKIFKLTKIKLGFNLLTYGLQLFILFYFKNFVGFLLIQFGCRFLERILTHRYIKREYKEVDFYKKQEIDKKTKMEIKTNIKGIIFHQVGSYAVNGTDNILISSVVNIATTGIYYNYASVIAILRNLIGSVISATTSSFGNLNVLEKSDVKKNVFRMINFVCLFLAGFVLVGLYFCINPFITLWLGEKYLLNTLCIIVICANFYLNVIMLPITAVKNSSGLYYVDRYIPVIQAVINLGVSVVLGLKFGLLGILLGTTVSYLCTVSITKPFIIYKYVFKTNCLEYFLQVLKNILLIVISILVSQNLLNFISLSSTFFLFLVNGVVSVFIYGILFLLFYFKTNEFQYFLNLVRKSDKEDVKSNQKKL